MWEEGCQDGHVLVIGGGWQTESKPSKRDDPFDFAQGRLLAARNEGGMTVVSAAKSSRIHEGDDCGRTLNARDGDTHEGGERIQVLPYGARGSKRPNEKPCQWLLRGHLAATVEFLKAAMLFGIRSRSVDIWEGFASGCLYQVWLVTQWWPRCW